jgi:hypothetical protein
MGRRSVEIYNYSKSPLETLSAGEIAYETGVDRHFVAEQMRLFAESGGEKGLRWGNYGHGLSRKSTRAAVREWQLALEREACSNPELEPCPAM